VALLKDAQAMMVQLESGAVDLVERPPLRDAGRLQSDSQFKVVVNALSGYYDFFYLNYQKPPLDNKKVRQALSFAADRQRMAANAVVGLGEARTLPWPSASRAAEPAKNAMYPFDLDKARAILEESGVGKQTLTLNYSTTSSELVNIAQIFQGDMAKLCIDLQLIPDLPGAPSVYQTGNYQIGLTINSWSQIDPSTIFDTLFYNTYPAPEFKRLRAAYDVEPDLEKRRMLMSQLNDVLLDESWLVSVTSSPSLVTTRAKVQGVQYGMHDNWKHADVWLS
jgi:ABC-type transport system substrate-binding protein